MPLLGPPARSGVNRVYLVRHGETAWSLTGRHTGRTDLDLTPHGEDEARALAPDLAKVRFAHVLTSPARRARRTCALAGLAAVAEVEPDLAEWDYGDYEGKLSADIQMERPGWSAYRDGCPGGETTPEVSDRADRVVARLRSLEGDVAVLSHGQFGCCVAAWWIGLLIVEGSHLQLDPASVSILGWGPEPPRAGRHCRVERLAEADGWPCRGRRLPASSGVVSAGQLRAAISDVDGISS